MKTEMPEILISTTTFAQFDEMPVKALKDKGYTVKLNHYGKKLSPQQVVELAGSAVGMVAGTEPLDKDVLEKLPNLKVISRCGTGLDNVDLDAANRLGIKVFNTPDAPTLAVAELTLAMILNLLRKINTMDRGLRNGKWDKLMGNQLTGKNIGIVGFGRIGRKVAELLRPFHAEIRFADPKVEDGRMDAKRVPLEELLGWADIITFHISSKSKILGEKEFGLLKKGSWIINVSRGGIIDEDLLYAHLTSGRISGAALDVYKEEPYNGRLKELDNVVLTPHIGSYAMEGRVGMEIESVRNLIKGLESL